MNVFLLLAAFALPTQALEISDDLRAFIESATRAPAQRVLEGAASIRTAPGRLVIAYPDGTERHLAAGSVYPAKTATQEGQLEYEAPSEYEKGEGFRQIVFEITDWRFEHYGGYKEITHEDRTALEVLLDRYVEGIRQDSLRFTSSDASILGEFGNLARHLVEERVVPLVTDPWRLSYYYESYIWTGAHRGEYEPSDEERLDALRRLTEIYLAADHEPVSLHLMIQHYYKELAPEELDILTRLGKVRTPVEG